MATISLNVDSVQIGTFNIESDNPTPYLLDTVKRSIEKQYLVAMKEYLLKNCFNSEHLIRSNIYFLLKSQKLSQNSLILSRLITYFLTNRNIKDIYLTLNDFKVKIDLDFNHLFEKKVYS